MTEADWLRSDNIRRMVEFICPRATYRKLRLLASALCRNVAPHLPAPGRLQDLDDERTTVRDAMQGPDETGYYSRGVAIAQLKGIWRSYLDDHEAGRSIKPPLQTHQPELARCIIGNPFRPVTADSVWLTPTVRGLAQAAYDQLAMPTCEPRGDRLAVLADALEESAGPAEMIAHLRGSGPHARGCWTVDEILGLW